MFCPKCGANVADSATSCPQCGTQMTPQPPQNYGQPLPQAQTDGKATTSMILGILSLICLGFLAGIPAIILGHISRSNIRKSMGRLKGDGMALAGLIMGYISVLCIPIVLILAAIVIPNLIHARISANEASALSTVRTLSTAEATYQATNPTGGYAADISTLGPDAGTVAQNCAGQWCTKNGYRFTIQADDKQPHESFVITAVPMQPERTGKNNFCATVDNVVRFEHSGFDRTSPYTAEECAALRPFGE